MRWTRAILLAAVLAGCGSTADPSTAPSPTPAAPASLPDATVAASSPSPAGDVASPSPSGTVDWSAIEPLDASVTELGAFPADWPALSFATATDTDLWWPNGSEGGPPAVARIPIDSLKISATIGLGGKADVFPPDAWGSAPSKGGIWVPLANQKAVALIDPRTERVARVVPVQATPYTVVEHGDDLWIADWEHSEVVRIDIPSGKQRLRVEGITEPTEIVIGDEGLWVNEHSKDTVVRLDPETGAELARVTVGGRPGVELGLGSVWARSDDEKTVARIDPGSNAIVATVPLPSNPTGVKVVGDAVWVATGPQRGSCLRNAYLVRIDPSSDAVNGIMAVPCLFGLTPHGGDLLFGRDVDGDRSLLRLDAARRS